MKEYAKFLFGTVKAIGSMLYVNVKEQRFQHWPVSRNNTFTFNSYGYRIDVKLGSNENEEEINQRRLIIG